MRTPPWLLTLAWLAVVLVLARALFTEEPVGLPLNLVAVVAGLVLLFHRSRA